MDGITKPITQTRLQWYNNMEGIWEIDGDSLHALWQQTAYDDKQ